MRQPDGTMVLLVQAMRRFTIRHVRADRAVPARGGGGPARPCTAPDDDKEAQGGIQQPARIGHRRCWTSRPEIPEQARAGPGQHRGPRPPHRPARGQPRPRRGAQAGSSSKKPTWSTRMRMVQEAVSRQTEIAELQQKLRKDVEGQFSTGQRRAYLREQIRAIQRELGEEEPGSEDQMEQLRTRLPGSRRARERHGDGRKGTQAARPYPQRQPGIQRHRLLRRDARRPALGQAQRRQHRPRPRAGGSRPRPLRPARRSSAGSSNTSRSASSTPPGAARSSASSGLPASARRASASPSPTRSAASSRASRWAASATRRKFAATAAPTSARCRAASSRNSAALGTRNPVLMLDEVDKLGADMRGDPASALLGSARPAPEQRVRGPLPRRAVRPEPGDFHRHGATTSKASPPRCATAWRSSACPATREREKLHIAQNYLVGRQLEENGLKPEQCRFEDEALRTIIDEYTHEAGVRDLERRIGAVCRSRRRRGRARRQRRRARCDGHARFRARASSARAIAPCARNA